MLHAENLGKSYGDRKVVDSLTFTVSPGTVTGFLGPNGSGKTTTIRMFLGLVRPTAGTAHIDGKPLGHWPLAARKVGAVLDGISTHPRRTAIDTLRWWGTLTGSPVSRADEVLEQVGLGAVGRHKVGTFSLGMRQRLALAMALQGRPEVLILDEPMNGLDPAGIAWLRDLLQDFAVCGGTVLLSSHQLAELGNVVHDLVVIGNGTLIKAGPMADFVAEHQVAATMVRTNRPEELTAAVRSRGGTSSLEPDGRLKVGGIDREALAELALGTGVLLYEMIPVDDLQGAFLRATAGSEEFAAATNSEPLR